MKIISTKELRLLCSLYIDDALDPDEKKNFELYLAAHSDVAHELDTLRRQKALLGSRSPLPPNEWFWEKLSHRLTNAPETGESVYPFSRKYLPIAAALTIVVAAFIGVLMFQQRDLLSRYFSEKKNEVQHLKENILQGNLLPLFTDLTKDQVLQFAFFGTLPLDAQAKTALRVDENKEDGTRIEFAKNEASPNPPVTVEQFYKEVDATPAQHQRVDSILASAIDKIQESVFLGENKSLAVHADLAKFNRTMVSHIAASLDLPQRKKFQKFLSVAHSPYTFAIAAQTPRPSHRVSQASTAPQPEQFVVITPDTCAIATMTMDMNNLRRMIDMKGTELRSVNARTHELLREFSSHSRLRINRDPSLQVYSDSDYFSVMVGEGVLASQRDVLPVEVTARAPKAIRFRYQLRDMPPMPNFFGDDSQNSVQYFQNIPRARGTTPRSGEQLSPRRIDLDSVVNAQRDRKASPKMNQNRKRYYNPFEL